MNDSGQGKYYVVMILVNAVFLLGAICIDGPFVLVFLSIVFTISFIVASSWESTGQVMIRQNIDHLTAFIKDTRSDINSTKVSSHSFTSRVGRLFV